MNVPDISASDDLTLAGLTLEDPTNLDTFSFDRWLGNRTSASGTDTSDVRGSTRQPTTVTSGMPQRSDSDPIQNQYRIFMYSAFGLARLRAPEYKRFEEVVTACENLKRMAPKHDHTPMWNRQLRGIWIFLAYRYGRLEEPSEDVRAMLKNNFTALGINSPTRSQLSDYEQDRLVRACVAAKDVMPWQSDMWELFRLMMWHAKKGEAMRTGLPM